MKPLNAAALAAFQRSLDGDVIATDDLEYDAARAVWNGIVDRRPALVARCTDAADVIKAVRFAREQDLVIAVRAGGHSVGGFSTCDGGIIIDLSRMREVSVDPQARFARVDGGALGGDLDREAHRKVRPWKKQGMRTVSGPPPRQGIEPRYERRLVQATREVSSVAITQRP
jgi:FAD/FMN-containing dehydrogenase